MQKTHKKKQLLVIAHDAGEGEIIAAYLRQNLKTLTFHAYIGGPAIKVFRRIGLPYKQVPFDKDKLQKLIEGNCEVAFILLGTGRSFQLIENTLSIAKKLNIKTIAYLESWVNYRERFGYPTKGWRKNIADEIWVGDRYALNMAKHFFPKTSLKLVPNIYFQDIKKRFSELKSTSIPSEILFLSDAMPGMEQVLHDLFVELAKQKSSFTVRIRFHPKDDRSRYDALIRKMKGSVNIRKSIEKDIVQDLLRAAWVVGGETVAMVPAVLVKKPTLSVATKGSKRQLPYSEIKRVRSGSEAVQMLLHNKTLHKK